MLPPKFVLKRQCIRTAMPSVVKHPVLERHQHAQLFGGSYIHPRFDQSARFGEALEERSPLRLEVKVDGFVDTSDAVHVYQRYRTQNPNAKRYVRQRCPLHDGTPGRHTM